MKTTKLELEKAIKDVTKRMDSSLKYADIWPSEFIVISALTKRTKHLDDQAKALKKEIEELKEYKWMYEGCST